MSDMKQLLHSNSELLQKLYLTAPVPMREKIVNQMHANNGACLTKHQEISIDGHLESQVLEKQEPIIIPLDIEIQIREAGTGKELREVLQEITEYIKAETELLREKTHYACASAQPVDEQLSADK